jgi:predicted transcriptional regulator of viral defense system
MSSAPPATKTTHEKQLIRLVRKRKLLRARDLAEQGLPTITLTRLVQAGKLDRVARGLHCMPGAAMSEHRSLAEVALLVPRGVVCLLSALRFHEIGTQAPFEVWLAIPNRIASPRIEHPAIRVVRMSDDALMEGLQHKRIDGVEVPSSIPRELSWTASSSATRSASTWHSKHFATAGENAGSPSMSSGTAPHGNAWPV